MLYNMFQEKKHLNCWTHQRRQEIIYQYKVMPIIRVTVSKGEHVRSDAGGQLLTREYYIFSATKKHEKDGSIIVCGEDSAKDFLQMLGHPPLPLFDPFNEFVRGGLRIWQC